MLPNLIVIGAKKAATTSLHFYLGLHPEIAMSPAKELNFFVEERNWRNGPDWYARQFPTPARVVGECCPQYTNYPRLGGVAERMHGLIPDARLIYMLRNPITRIVADYVHKCAAGNESRSLAQALGDLENNAYVHRSCYHAQLMQYLPHYPLSRILLVTQEDLLARRAETLRRIFRFLEVDERFESPRFDELRHESRKKRRGHPLLLAAARRLRHSPLSTRFPTAAHLLDQALTRPFSSPIASPEIPASLRAPLADVLGADLERLRQLTGQRFAELEPR